MNSMLVGLLVALSVVQMIQSVPYGREMYGAYGRDGERYGDRYGERYGERHHGNYQPNYREYKKYDGYERDEAGSYDRYDHDGAYDGDDGYDGYGNRHGAYGAARINDKIKIDNKNTNTNFNEEEAFIVNRDLLRLREDGKYGREYRLWVSNKPSSRLTSIFF